MGGQRGSAAPLPVCRMTSGLRSSSLAFPGPPFLPRIPQALDFGSPLWYRNALLLNALQKHGRTLVTQKQLIGNYFP